MELRALSGWRYYFSLFLEFSDITMPFVRSVVEKISSAISFFLVCLIGRLFLEYIGLDTMMAIVCKTLKGVKALETYDKDESIRVDISVGNTILMLLEQSCQSPGPVPVPVPISAPPGKFYKLYTQSCQSPCCSHSYMVATNV
ncbi:hypothetical protein GIB67_032037 [Kingdonia uniflora]|uniref:Uncharacterized protein n=1 Tax=Kingdonia uniflora TaxID=39325 RepID=A0A7J7MWL2_9MAGN|nr:hypothetical protein GIB67_032037 [Kingdonia uniflora]